MEYTYKTKGVCSTQMVINVDNNIVKSVIIENGCSGNAKGISSLVEGMHIEDVIKKLKGIKCGYRATSCPDQLAQALKNIKA